MKTAEEPCSIQAEGKDGRSGMANTRKKRASGLSRNHIVKSGLRYLQDNPDEPLTIARVAAASGAATMAIYRHFESRADLAEAILAEALCELTEFPVSDQPWQEELRSWMTLLTQRLTQTPQCNAMLDTPTGLSPTWLRAAASLQQILGRSGLKGEKLSQAVFFVSTVAVGYARLILAAPFEQTINTTVASISKMQCALPAAMADFAADIPGIYRDSLNVIVDHVIGVVESRARNE